ncbi:hypothetical protein GCM10028775_66010 [Catellatospora paridis]
MLVGTVTALVLCAAIYLGSRGLHNFDSALAPYAIAGVFLAFGIAYRYTVWISSPGARRLFKKGWGAALAALAYTWTQRNRRPPVDATVRPKPNMR